MKKVLFLFLLVPFISCSSDSQEELVNDPAGNWRLEKIVFGGTTYTADECMSQMTYSLLEDQSVDHDRILFLTPVDPDAECTPAAEEYEYYTWRNISGSSFEFEYKIEGEDPVKIPFQIEGNTMTVDQSGNVTETYTKI